MERRYYQVESLVRAIHMLNDNIGVLRRSQRGHKSYVEHKGKSLFDSYEKLQREKNF